jgi:PPP family 3-phenylpropionic acid transporter
MTQSIKKGPTIRYGVIQAGFWMDYLIIGSFAAIFLGNRGFTTAETGMIIAAGALISCVLQQISGSFVDKHDSIPLKYFVTLFIAVCFACMAILMILPHRFVSTAIFYVTAYSIQCALSPLVNSLCLQFTNNGYSINFGLSRSFGSFGYAAAALVMGNVTNMFGSEIILPIYVAIYGILLVVLFMFPVPVKDKSAKIVAGNELIDRSQPCTMKEFISKYHRFLLLMVGFVFLWLENSMIGTYMIYFIKDLGGNSSDMGLALSVMAFSEIPAVLFGNNIMSRIGAPRMLQISALGGILKAVLFFISPNVTFFVWCNVTHIFLSGFYQVSAIYYCYSIVGEKDIVKGQALLGVATGGICAMLASSIGGFLLEFMSHKMILALGIAVSILAAVVIFYAIDPNHFKNEEIRRI